jgi:hypothetical protein
MFTRRKQDIMAPEMAMRREEVSLLREERRDAGD